MADGPEAEAMMAPYGLGRFTGLVAVVLLSVVLLSGCTKVGPDFLRPSAKVSDQWLEARDPRAQGGTGDLPGVVEGLQRSRP